MSNSKLGACPISSAHQAESSFALCSVFTFEENSSLQIALLCLLYQKYRSVELGDQLQCTAVFIDSCSSCSLHQTVPAPSSEGKQGTDISSHTRLFLLLYSYIFLGKQLQKSQFNLKKLSPNLKINKFLLKVTIPPKNMAIYVCALSPTVASRWYRDHTRSLFKN